MYTNASKKTMKACSNETVPSCAFMMSLSQVAAWIKLLYTWSRWYQQDMADMALFIIGGVPRWIPGTSTRNHRKPWILAAKCGGPCQKKLKSILGSYQALSWLQLFFCCRCNSASSYHFWPWWIHSSALGLMQQNCDASVVMIGIIYMELHLFFVYHVYITSICVYVFIWTLKHHQNWPPLKINRARILNGSHSQNKKHVAAVDPWPVKQTRNVHIEFDLELLTSGRSIDMWRFPKIWG